jgi:uncharacterized protein YndB with AHSA1/START domain
MSRTVVTRTIAAPVAKVFQTVADISQFSQALPHIVKVEFLSDVKTGLGARFRETRLMQGNEHTTELEVTEYVPDERIRLVADSHGTVWDTLFTVAPHGSGTLLTMTMDARAYKLLARIMNLLIAGMVRKQIEKDMDAVKAFCERGAS